MNASWVGLGTILDDVRGYADGPVLLTQTPICDCLGFGEWEEQAPANPLESAHLFECGLPVSAGPVRASLPSALRTGALGWRTGGAALPLPPLPAPLDLGFPRARLRPPQRTRVLQAVWPAAGAPDPSRGLLPAVAVRPSRASELRVRGTSAISA